MTKRHDVPAAAPPGFGDRRKLEDGLNALRERLAQLDAFASTAAERLDNITWSGTDRRQLSHIDVFVQLAAESATAALSQLDQVIKNVLEQRGSKSLFHIEPPTSKRTWPTGKPIPAFRDDAEEERFWSTYEFADLGREDGWGAIKGPRLPRRASGSSRTRTRPRSRNIKRTK